MNIFFGRKRRHFINIMALSKGEKFHLMDDEFFFQSVMIIDLLSYKKEGPIYTN